MTGCCLPVVRKTQSMDADRLGRFASGANCRGVHWPQGGLVWGWTRADAAQPQDGLHRCSLPTHWHCQEVGPSQQLPSAALCNREAWTITKQAPCLPMTDACSRCVSWFGPVKYSLTLVTGQCMAAMSLSALVNQLASSVRNAIDQLHSVKAYCATQASAW